MCCKEDDYVSGQVCLDLRAHMGHLWTLQNAESDAAGLGRPDVLHP